jgi:hypothetical protein
VWDFHARRNQTIALIANKDALETTGAPNSFGISLPLRQRGAAVAAKNSIKDILVSSGLPA